MSNSHSHSHYQGSQLTKKKKKDEKLKASGYTDITVFVYFLLPICSPKYKCKYNRHLQLTALSDTRLQTVEITEN
jgi:hypothetical protein